MTAAAALEMVRASGVPIVHLRVHDCSPELIAAARQLEGAEWRIVENDGFRFEAVGLYRDGAVLGFYGVSAPIAAPAEVAS